MTTLWPPTLAPADDLRDIFRVVLRGPVRANGMNYLLPRFRNLSIAGHKFGHGDGSLTFWEDGHPLIAAMMELSGFGFSVDVYFNNLTTPLYTGVVKHTSATSRVGSPPEITLTMEGIDNHILRRRLNVTYANAISEYSAYPCDHLVLSILRNAVGGLTPYGYTVDRSWWGRGAVTGVTVASAKVPGGPTFYFGEESGNNVVDVIYGIMEATDCALVCIEQTPGYWFLDVDRPYVSKDISDIVRFSETNGELESLTRDTDFSAIENVYLMKGEGAKTAQVYTWIADGTSVTARGVFEGTGTKSGVSNTIELANQAYVDLFKSKDPIETWTIELAQRASSILRFNTLPGFSVRHRVTIETYRLAGSPNVPGMDPVPGAPDWWTWNPVSVQVPIVGYALNANGYTWPQLSLTLGKPARNLNWELRQRIGSRGGRGQGDWHLPSHGG